MKNRSIVALLLAFGLTLPGTVGALSGLATQPTTCALLSGLAILGASFLLLWACDAAQSDLSQALALAIVALIAVAPEYSVDMYFTWQAGQHPDGNYAHYAIANMTGANRLLIGVAWSAIVALYWVRHRRAVRIQKDQRTELFFLGLATLYAFLIPIKGTLAWYDGLVFLGLYVWYILLAARRPHEEVETEGPARLIVALPTAKRRLATGLLFAFAGGVILANAKPFCEGLVGTGHRFKINEFLLVQWLAPIASEAPEFIVALVFTWRGRAGLALGSLLSAKLNQWTLLVGMIPGVFALSHGSLAHPIPMGSFQMHEIMLTAAQSLLAVALLASLRLPISGAFLLLGLFVGQLVLPELILAYPALDVLGLNPEQIHPLFSILYVMAALAIFLQSPRSIVRLWQGLRIASAGEGDPAAEDGLDPSDDEQECCGASDEEPYHSSHCRQCKYRQAAIRASALSAEPKRVGF